MATPSRLAASMRAASHRLMASVFRLDEAADRIEMGARYVPSEDRAEWHEKQARFYDARAAGLSVEEAEKVSESGAGGSGMPDAQVGSPGTAAHGVPSVPGAREIA